MRGLWISIAATAILLVIWGLFIGFANGIIKDMVFIIDDSMAYAADEDWPNAGDDVEKTINQWSKNRLLFSLFFDAVSISDVEGTMFRAKAYGQAEEKAAFLAELAYLRHLLLFLFENETISIENIL